MVQRWRFPCVFSLPGDVERGNDDGYGALVQIRHGLAFQDAIQQLLGGSVDVHDPREQVPREKRRPDNGVSVQVYDLHPHAAVRCTAWREQGREARVKEKERPFCRTMGKESAEASISLIRAACVQRNAWAQMLHVCA